MSIIRRKGDAAKRAQIVEILPPVITSGPIAFEVGFKRMNFTSWNPTAMVARLNGRTDPIDLVSQSGEFQEIEFEVNDARIRCTAREPGRPFDLHTYINGLENSSERQKLIIVNNPTGGTFTISFSGQTTAAIAYNASASAIVSALEALSNIGVGDVAVFGSFPEWLIDFQGQFTGVNVDQTTVNRAGLTGGNCTISVAASNTGATPNNEIQTFDIQGTPDGGTFTLSFNGQTTAAIAYNASAATVEAALEALTVIGSGNVTCTGGPCPALITVEFTSDLGSQDVPQLTANGSGLTQSDTLNATVTTLQAAVSGTNSKWNFKWNLDPGSLTGKDCRWIITYNGGQCLSSWIPLSSTVAQMKTALGEALQGGAGDFTPGADNTTFTGDLPGSWVGGDAGMSVEFIDGMKSRNVDLEFQHSNTGSAIVGRSVVTAGTAGTDEIQRITLNATPLAANYFITFDGRTTAAVNFSSDGEDFAANALNNLLEGDNEERYYNTRSYNTNLKGATDSHHSGPISFQTSGDAIDIRFVAKGYQATNVPQITVSASPVGGYSIDVATTTQGYSGVYEQQVIHMNTNGSTPFGGTFTLTYSGQTTSALDFDATAGEVQTALIALSNIGPSDVVCSGGPFPNIDIMVTFDKSLGNTALITGIATGVHNANMSAITVVPGGDAINIIAIQESEGPEHFDVAENYDLRRLPNWGDNLVIDTGDTNLKFMLKQSTLFGFVSFSNSASHFVTSSKRRIFRNGQVVRLRIVSGALPTGLAINTNYTIADAPEGAGWLGTFRLLNSSGDVIVCSSSGSGSWIVEIRITVDAYQSWNGGLGLPDVNEDNTESYVEYRPTKLECGLTVINVGEGLGSGPTMMRVKGVGIAMKYNVHNGGQQSQAGTPSFTVENEDFANEANLFKGSIAIAQKAGQLAFFPTLRVGYRDNVTSDVQIIIGPNVDLDVIEQSGGSISTESLIPTHRMIDGRLEVVDGGAGTINADKGTILYYAEGTISAVNLGSGCSFDCSQDMRPRTITQLNLHAGSELRDPFGTIVLPNGYNLIRCNEGDCVIDLPPNANIVRTPL